MSKGMRSRCQRECDADVIIMRSRCQGECEADVKSNAKPMSHRARSRCREGTHTRTRARRREVQTHTNKLTPSKGTIRCKVFGVIFNSYLNDFGGHIGMILLLLWIEFWDIFQIMRSLCQEECEAYVEINAKPTSRCANNLVLEQITGTHQICYSI